MRWRLRDILIDVLEPPANRPGGDPSRQLKPKPSKTMQESSHRVHLCIFEENEAAIKMRIKDRRPHMRHVSRTHRDTLHWPFERVNLNSNTPLQHVHANQQIADSLTKVSSTREKWNELANLFGMVPEFVFRSKSSRTEAAILLRTSRSSKARH